MYFTWWWVLMKDFCVDQSVIGKQVWHSVLLFYFSFLCCQVLHSHLHRCLGLAQKGPSQSRSMANKGPAISLAQETTYGDVQLLPVAWRHKPLWFAMRNVVPPLLIRISVEKRMGQEITLTGSNKEFLNAVVSPRLHTSFYMEAAGYVRPIPEWPNLKWIILTNFCKCSYLSKTPAKTANHLALWHALSLSH